MTPFHETAPTGPTAARAAAMQALIPVLETERLILRAPRIADFGPFVEATAGARAKFYGNYESREHAWADFMQLTGTWLLRGHGAWTVTDRTTGAVLGFVQIGAEPGDREPELGYVVNAEAEGKSIAFEAATAVRDAGFGDFALESLVSYNGTDNARSCALAKRLRGTRDRDAETALGDETTYVFRHHPGGRA